MDLLLFPFFVFHAIPCTSQQIALGLIVWPEARDKRRACFRRVAKGEGVRGGNDPLGWAGRKRGLPSYIKLQAIGGSKALCYCMPSMSAVIMRSPMGGGGELAQAKYRKGRLPLLSPLVGKTKF